MNWLVAKIVKPLVVIGISGKFGLVCSNYLFSSFMSFKLQSIELLVYHYFTNN